MLLEATAENIGARAVAADMVTVDKSVPNPDEAQEYGGAPLLGVNGYCLICHGRSESKAIRNAIRVAKQLVASNVNEKIVALVEKSIPVGED